MQHGRELPIILTALRAAFPADPVGEATMLLYEEKLADLDPVLLGAAIDNIIVTERHFPVLGVILDGYRAQQRARIAVTPALPEPDLTPGQQAENAAGARELRERIERGLPRMGE